MEQLVEKMQRLLASTFTLYLKAHNFHWNVVGQDFSQYHSFFGSFYDEVFDSVDTTAEQIRALDARAKGSLTEFKELSVIRDQLTPISLQDMVAMLYRDNEALIAVLMDAHDAASSQRQFGLVNYLEGRIDTHKKHSWMLRSSMTSIAVKEELQPVQESVQGDARVYEITFNK